MSCYVPFPVKLDWDNNQKKYTVIWLTKILGQLRGTKKQYRDYINENWKDMDFLPCSRCIGCRLSKAKEWASRCQLEALNYGDNYFVTFTYSPDYLPVVDKTVIPTLHKTDMKRFIKSLRNFYQYNKNHTGIRYFGSGEYGGRTGRPHYHYIFFNLPLYDLVPFGGNKMGNKYYISKFLTDLWGKGHVIIGSFSYETAGYVARYTSKKITFQGVHEQEDVDYGDAPLNVKSLSEAEKKLLPQPEYLNMSSHPGIGYKYFVENKQHIYAEDSILMRNTHGVFRIKPSRYFDKKMAQIDPDFMFELKKKRKELTTLARVSQLSQTDKSFIAYMADLQRQLYKKLKLLTRNKI